jgi:hypothetical protein
MNGYSAPSGSIGTSNMRSWYSNMGRLHTRSDITAGRYIPRAGDYLSLFDGGHSAIFADWVDSISGGITNNTRYRTVEGNTSSAVRVCIRRVSNIDHVGDTP